MTSAHFGRFLSGPVSISLCLALLVSACAVLPGPTQERVPHIGALVGGPPDSILANQYVDDLGAGLRDLGYIDGQTISIEWRFPTDSSNEKFGEAGSPTQSMQGRIQAVEVAATTLGVQVQVLTVRSPDDVEARLADALAARVDGLMHLGGPGVVTTATPQIAEFARLHRLPLMTNALQYVQAGGLLGYGPNVIGIGRQAASYVDRILKGATPGDLPVQEPTTYDLVVNQTTAQLLGIAIPPDIANQVTAWIQ
jgi:hypothetical protein